MCREFCTKEHFVIGWAIPCILQQKDPGTSSVDLLHCRLIFVGTRPMFQSWSRAPKTQLVVRLNLICKEDWLKLGLMVGTISHRGSFMKIQTPHEFFPIGSCQISGSCLGGQTTTRRSTAPLLRLHNGDGVAKSINKCALSPKGSQSTKMQDTSINHCKRHHIGVIGDLIYRCEPLELHVWAGYKCSAYATRNVPCRWLYIRLLFHRHKLRSDMGCFISFHATKRGWVPPLWKRLSIQL